MTDSTIALTICSAVAGVEALMIVAFLIALRGKKRTNAEIQTNVEWTRIKLEGRIYPAVKSCVRNRYLIVSGFLAYAALLLTGSDARALVYSGNALRALAVPIVFSAFVVHNFFNYVLNAVEQVRLENGKEAPLFGIWIEGASALVSALAIWFGYNLLGGM
ncbi:MAG: hypothetical protein ACLQMF_08970 [Rectinemataceae bacterium]